MIGRSGDREIGRREQTKNILIGCIVAKRNKKKSAAIELCLVDILMGQFFRFTLQKHGRPHSAIFVLAEYELH